MDSWAPIGATATEDRAFVEWSAKQRNSLGIDKDPAAFITSKRDKRPDAVVPEAWWNQLYVDAATAFVDKHVSQTLANLCAELLHRTVDLERPALTRVLQALFQPQDNTPDMDALMDSLYRELVPSWDTAMVGAIRAALKIMEDHFERNVLLNSPEWAKHIKPSLTRASATPERAFQLQVRLGTSPIAIAARDYLTAPPDAAIQSLDAWMNHLDKVMGPAPSVKAAWMRARRWLRPTCLENHQSPLDFSEADWWIESQRLDRFMSHDQYTSIKQRIKDHRSIPNILERMDKDFALADIISQGFVSSEEDPILPDRSIPVSTPSEALGKVNGLLDQDAYAVPRPEAFGNAILNPMRIAATKFSEMLGAPPRPQDSPLTTAMLGREQWSLYYRAFFRYSGFGESPKDTQWEKLIAVLVHNEQEFASSQFTSVAAEWNFARRQFKTLVDALNALEKENVRNGSGWVTRALWKGNFTFEIEDEYHKNLQIAKGAHGLAVVMAIRAAIYSLKSYHTNPTTHDADVKLSDEQLKALREEWEMAILTADVHVAYWRMLWSEYGANWFDRTALPVRLNGTRARRLAHAIGDSAAWLGVGLLSREVEKNPAVATDDPEGPLTINLTSTTVTQPDTGNVAALKSLFWGKPEATLQSNSESFSLLNGTSSIESVFLKTCTLPTTIDIQKDRFQSDTGLFFGYSPEPSIYTFDVDITQNGTSIERVRISAREFVQYLIGKGKADPAIVRTMDQERSVYRNANEIVDRALLPEFGMCIPKGEIRSELLLFIWNKLSKNAPERTLRRIFDALSLHSLLDARTVFDAVKLTASFCLGMAPVRIAATVTENVLFQPPSTVAEFRDSPAWQQSSTTSWLQLCKDAFLGTNPSRRMRTSIDPSLMDAVAMTPMELEGDMTMAFGKLVAEATLRAAGRSAELQTVSYLASAMLFGVPAPCWILLAMAVRYATLDPVRSIKSVIVDMLLVALLGAYGVTSWEKVSVAMTSAFALLAVAVVGVAEFWPHLAHRLTLKK